MPSLVDTGDDDRWVPTEQSVRLASELPDADLVVIPECDHLPQEEHPELFLQAVSGFLSQLPEAKSEKKKMSKKVQVNTIAPDFTLEDSKGRNVLLSDYRQR